MEYIFSLDLATAIRTIGYLGLFAIVFSESGLLIGFFLPGDSLLFTAGFLASQGFLNIFFLLPICFLAAVLGDSFGYAFGRRFGPRVFRREESRFFKKEYIERTQMFYERHGGRTIILARFMPVIRTLAPIFAGVGRMYYPAFLFYNIIGGLLWAGGLTLLGFFLGSVVPNVNRYIIPIIFLIILFSSLPPALHVWREKKHGAP